MNYAENWITINWFLNITKQDKKLLKIGLIKLETTVIEKIIFNRILTLTRIIYIYMIMFNYVYIGFLFVLFGTSLDVI